MTEFGQQLFPLSNLCFRLSSDEFSKARTDFSNPGGIELHDRAKTEVGSEGALLVTKAFSRLFSCSSKVLDREREKKMCMAG